MMMWLHGAMPAAVYGPSAAVPMQKVHPMDLLALSCCSVSAAAEKKAVKTWLARRQFCGVHNGRFDIVNVLVLSAGQI
jgi:hypothetical protein